MLALAAARSVLEMGDIVHGLKVFCFFILRNIFVFCLWFSSSDLLPDDRLRSASNGPDETQ